MVMKTGKLNMIWVVPGSDEGHPAASSCGRHHMIHKGSQTLLLSWQFVPVITAWIHSPVLKDHRTVDYVLVCDLQGHVHIIPQQGVQNKRSMGIVWASGPEAVIPGRNRGFGHFLEEVKPLGAEIERGSESRIKICARCAETMLESKTYAECGIQR